MSIRKCYNTSISHRSYLRWDSEEDEEIIFQLFGVSTDPDSVWFPQGQFDELQKKGKDAILAGRAFEEKEEAAMMVSSRDCFIHQWDQEEIVGKKVTLSCPDTGKIMDIVVVGVYDNYLSIHGNRKIGKTEAHRPDYIFSSDVCCFFRLTGDEVTMDMDPREIEVNLDSMEHLEEMIIFLQDEYGLGAGAVSEQLIGISALTKEYSRMLQVMAFFSYLVVSAMLFSVLYRNMQERRKTRELLRSLGMEERMIRKLQRREAAVYGFFGCLIGTVVGTAACTAVGAAALLDKPEFHSVWDVVPKIDTIAVPVTICAALIILLSETVVFLTGRADRRVG